MSLDNTQFLTIEQAADLVKCHPQTIRNAINRGSLPIYRVEKCIRIGLVDLIEYMRTQAANGKKFGRKEVDKDSPSTSPKVKGDNAA